MCAYMYLPGISTRKIHFKNTAASVMNLSYREATQEDLQGIKNLGLSCWQQFGPQLTGENQALLYKTLTDDNTYASLLAQSQGFLCLSAEAAIVGMAFLVPSGNPTDIYDKAWSYIRFVSVAPEYEGKGIGRQLTRWCIKAARENGEHTIALHTSEMMEKARRLYESLGFSILREIEPRLGKRYWLYSLNLDA